MSNKNNETVENIVTVAPVADGEEMTILGKADKWVVARRKKCAEKKSARAEAKAAKKAEKENKSEEKTRIPVGVKVGVGLAAAGALTGAVLKVVANSRVEAEPEEDELIVAQDEQPCMEAEESVDQAES